MTRKRKKLVKRATGIPGLDEITQGGLPASTPTLIMGTPGSGKTVLCLQVIANSLDKGKGAVYVTFEESTEQILHDAASFTWADKLATSDKFKIIDARLQTNVMGDGSFELDGLLALLDASVKDIDADWVVLDGIDHLLRLQADEPVTRHFIQLSNWCATKQISLLITSKSRPGETYPPLNIDGAEFLVSCVVGLSAEVHASRLNRRFRIIKYRGTGHNTNELPMVIDSYGLHLPFSDQDKRKPLAEYDVAERCSTGIPRLDEVIGGGLLRGSTTLISGQPGTSKTTLSASITNAAVQRGERVLYVSFDEEAQRFLYNLTSVGIVLEPFIKKGKLKLDMRLAWRHLVEEHYIAIHRLLHEFKPHWLIVDPVSALIKSTSVERAHISIERLLGEARERSISIVLTSLTMSDTPELESTLSHASTLADSWISLSYNINGGERNRALSVVKSRGTAHTNQVRELLVSNEGIDLADVYQYGTDVLMGTARVQKQLEVSQEAMRQQREMHYRERILERELEKAREQSAYTKAEQQRLLEEIELLKQSRENEGEDTTSYFGYVRESRTKPKGEEEARPTQTGRARKKHRKGGDSK